MNRLISLTLATAVAAFSLANAGVAAAKPDHEEKSDKAEAKAYEHDQKADEKHFRTEEKSFRADDREEWKADRQTHTAWRRYATRRYQDGAYIPPAGYVHSPWVYGRPLPRAYRAAPYAVNYRTYDLAPPPPGYNYVRVGNDVVLADTVTGVVRRVVLNLFR